MFRGLSDRLVAVAEAEGSAYRLRFGERMDLLVDDKALAMPPSGAASLRGLLAPHVRPAFPTSTFAERSAPGFRRSRIFVCRLRLTLFAP
jgi:hypothetical protein